eukprot:g321.t1
MLLRTAARSLLGPALRPPGGGRAVSCTARRLARKKDKAAGEDAGPPKIDSTVFFRMTNPELFLDVKSARTWYLVGFVWFAFGGSYLYLRYEESQEEAAEEARQAARRAILRGPAPTSIGPAPRPPPRDT